MSLSPPFLFTRTVRRACISDILYIQTGDIQRNTIQFINVSEVFKLLSPTFINALPAWFVFSGCKYEPSFYGKGCKSCLKILEKNVEFQIAFAQIGNDLDTQYDDYSTLEEYTCQLYHSNAKTVNETRLHMFEDSYKNVVNGKNVDFSKNGNEIRCFSLLHVCISAT